MKDSEIEKAMKLELQARRLKYHSGIIQESFISLKKSNQIILQKSKIIR